MRYNAQLEGVTAAASALRDAALAKSYQMKIIANHTHTHSHFNTHSHARTHSHTKTLTDRHKNTHTQ